MKRMLILGLALMGLAACANLPGRKPSVVIAPPPGAENGPILQVALPKLGAATRMFPHGQNGMVTTWAAVDGITVSLDRGVVVATRGLGDDLMGADASGTLTALAGGGDEVYRRQMRYLTGDNHSTWVMAGCSMQAVGGEGGLRRYDEACQTKYGDVTNSYWLGGGGGVIRARQWISPQIGYLETARVAQ